MNESARPPAPSGRPDGERPATADPAIEELDRLAEQAATGDGTTEKRLSRYIRRVRFGGLLLAVWVAGTGLLAIVLSLAAWGDQTLLAIVAVIAAVPALLAPLYVARRTGALARTLSHPQEAVNEARDLLGGMTASPELRELARRVTGRGAGPDGKGVKPGRLRGGLKTLRLASTVVGQAGPDPSRHKLLTALRPDRLSRLWLGVTMAAWGWLVAAVVAVMALIALAADRL